MVYFMVIIFPKAKKEPDEYGEYIEQVKPIVENDGGKYLVRSNKVIPLQSGFNPKRVIMIKWETKKQLERCFSSEEYKRIACKRENSVDSKAIIVEE